MKRSPGLTLGKHSAPFTMDGSTSSKELLAVDRSNLTNNVWFTQEYVPGVSAAGGRSPWIYHLGLYSAGDANREFGRFNGSSSHSLCWDTISRESIPKLGSVNTI